MLKKILLSLFCLLLTMASALGEIELQRTLSQSSVESGSSVTIVYRVENTEDVPVTAFSLTDPLFGEIASEEKLAKGETRIYTISAVISKDCVSTPTAVYKKSGQTCSVSLEALPITTVQKDLKVYLAVSANEAYQNEIVTLSAYIVNTGSAVLKDITLTDSALGELGTSYGELKPGEIKEWNYSCKLTDTTDFCATAQACTLAGETHTATSNLVTIDMIKQTASAITMTAKSDSPNEYLLTITNDAAADIKDIQICEKSAGYIRTVKYAAPGTTTIRCSCETSGTLQFYAQYTSDNNSSITVFSNPLESNAADASEAKTYRITLSGSIYPILVYGALGFIGLMLLVIGIRAGKIYIERKLKHEERAEHIRRLKANARMQEEEWVRTKRHRFKIHR